MYVVAIKREEDNPYVYDWKGSYESEEMASEIVIKYENAIIIYDVEPIE